MAPRPSYGPGSRGGRGSRGVRGGSSRGQPHGSGRGSKPRPATTRSNAPRTSNRLSTQAEKSSKPKKIKFNFKAKEPGGTEATKSSFLGEYDRELDEHPTEPLVFEEQFILRVPKDVAEGPNGLREMIRGKGKGLEGVEFKFLGKFSRSPDHGLLICGQTQGGRRLGLMG